MKQDSAAPPGGPVRWKLPLPRHPASTCLGMAVAFVVSFALYRMSVPLAWLLGPLVVTGILALSGLELRPPPALRRIAQLTIGVTVGLNLTAEVVVRLTGLLPVMAAAALASILAAAVLSVLLAKWTQLDTRTTYFANLPGGLAEMSNIGSQVGADPEPIAVVQTVRVAMLALAVPPILFSFGVSPDPPVAAVPDIPLLWLPVMVVGGGALAYVFGLLRLNNPWMIGATVCAATFTAIGWVHGHMPQPIFLLAQYLIGVAVGSLFRPFMIRRLPRVTLWGLLSVLLLGLSMVAFSFAAGPLFGIGIPTMILATSPGGMSEMAATAQALNLAVSTVVAFQIIRALLVNAFAVHLWTVLSRLGFFATLERWFGKS